MSVFMTVNILQSINLPTKQTFLIPAKTTFHTTDNLGLVEGKCYIPQCIVWFQKIFLLPHRKDWNFQGGGGVLKTQKFKAMHEAKLEFPEGWGRVIGQIPSVGYGYFLEPHI